MKLIRNTRSQTRLFFDTETTGLSGASGTLAFVTGMSRWTSNGLATEQLFVPILA